MTQEEKDLLLKDLCARLPYGVKVQIIKNLHLGIFTLYPSDIDKLKLGTADIKPYLRPMSSMTEEEEEERQELWHSSFSPTEYATLFLDFCNERHLDYRGLIDKGRAIKVTEENNPYKD